jgi:hypothetical protein
MINLVMAEFGRARKNAGGSKLNPVWRLEPTLSTMLKFFPDLYLTIYTDQDIKVRYPPETVIKKVPLIGDPKHPRAPWRSSSYWKHFGLLESPHIFSVAMDSDLYVYSSDVKRLSILTKRFGLCLPMNPRLLVRVDTMVGADSDRELDETGGTGFAVNLGVMSFWRDHAPARRFLEAYCKRRKVEGRSTVSMWRTIWESGSHFHPYMLPIQWCVCKKDVGVGDEIILHAGHQAVREYYKV